MDLGKVETPPSSVSHEAATPPGVYGRRSRRGFYYQDACALHDCLDMVEGKWDKVVLENFEDITCESTERILYKQVKTDESPEQLHSIATLCRPEKGRGPGTSMLGRLFVDKPLPDNAELELVLNEQVNTPLQAFVVVPDVDSTPAPEATVLEMTGKLSGLQPPNERTIEWCLRRFHIRIESRTPDDLENRARARLGNLISLYLQESPLTEEVEDILIHLLWKVSAVARNVAVTPLNRDDFIRDFIRIGERTLRRSIGSAPDYTSLREKLNIAGVQEYEIDHAVEMSLRYSRKLRTTVGRAKHALDSLSDSVYMVCAETSALRRAGELEPGPKSYAETIRSISAMWDREDHASNGLSKADAWGALAFITSRCRNRYHDD
ncbi:dsDNA nuclease domain-containing protein [Nonomuraea sp. MTCD27]|uniref:dsDNA nuclease domain-containing protein n=1 Tax=Nonomuraea sp. MTCD27 TaxID=1676747 RepID=UPI0035C18BBC